MKIKMKLLSDTVFGNGISVPGGEDISVLHDEQGFPYYKGGTLKGIFREELQRYLLLCGEDEANVDKQVRKLLGVKESNAVNSGKLIFSNLTISDKIKKVVLDEISQPEDVLNAFTNLRTFTAMDENGTVKKGSLRVARCVNQGIYYEGEIICDEKDEQLVSLVEEILGMIKFIGTMRNRGFGKVKFWVEEAKNE